MASAHSALVTGRLPEPLVIAHFRFLQRNLYDLNVELFFDKDFFLCREIFFRVLGFQMKLLLMIPVFMQ